METVVWAHGGATCRGHGTTAVRVSRQPQGGDASSLDIADDKGGRKRPKAKATEGKTAVIVRGPRRSRLARVKSPPASLERPGENPAGTSRGRAPASARGGSRRVLWRSRWPRGGRACRSCCGRGRTDTRPTRQSTARDTCNEAATLQSPLRARPRGLAKSSRQTTHPATSLRRAEGLQKHKVVNEPKSRNETCFGVLASRPVCPARREQTVRT